MPTVPPSCRGSRPKARRVSAAARKRSVYSTRGLPWAERVKVVRQGEDHVEVRNRQEVGLPCRQPLLLGARLTLRAVAIATRVIGEAHHPAAVTRLPMPAEGGGAAGRDRPDRPMLDRGESMRARIRLAMGAHDVGQFQPRDAGDRRARGHGAHRLSPGAVR